VPALPSLWGTQDVINRHRRRYTKRTLLETYRRAGLPAPRVTYSSALLFARIAAGRWARRLWPAPAEERSDFEMSRHGFMNELLAALMALERLVVGRVPLPVGTSLLAVSSATTAP
jgi:hypothetical protein